MSASACNRADTDAIARRASAGMREAASRAGDRLADSWLATKIQAQYFADEDIKAWNINVSTREGVVTLAGRVDSAPRPFFWHGRPKASSAWKTR